MSSLKPVPIKELVSSWEISRTCHLSTFVFLVALSYFATCESMSSNLYSARNSSTFSTLQSVFVTSSPHLSSVHYGQTSLRSPTEQTSLAMAIKTVNDGFISQFGVHTGRVSGHGPGIRTTKVLASSSSTKNAPTTEQTQGSQLSAGESLQTENRNAQSTRGGVVETPNLQTTRFTSDSSKQPTILMAKSSHTQVNTESRIASKINSTFDESKMINARATSTHSDFTHIKSTIISIEPSVLLQSSVKSKIATFSRTSGATRALSIFSPSHEKFTDSVSRLQSNLHAASNVYSTNDLSPAKESSKSIFLSPFSTGTTAQVRNISSDSSSTARETTQVAPPSSNTMVSQESSISTSTAIKRISSSYISSAVPKDSSDPISSAAQKTLLTSMPRDSPKSTTIVRVSTSFTSATLKSNKTLSTRHTYTTRATTASPSIAVTRFSSIQPSFSSSVAVQGKAPLSCKLNNVTCICFNCEQARKSGQTCCTDLIDSKNIQQGVKLSMKNITVEMFHTKVTVVSQIIAEVILDTCKENSSLCLSNEQLSNAPIKRKRRSLKTQSLKGDSSLNIVRTKRDSDSLISHSSSVNTEALRPEINLYKSNISHVEVIIYSISSKAGDPYKVQTAFYVTMTSFYNGTNRIQVVDGKGLLQILRDKREILESRLNITIDSFSAWQSNDSDTTSQTFLTTMVPNPSPGSQNSQTSLSTPQVPTTAVLGIKSEDDDKKGFSQSTLIVIICAAIGGLVILVVLLVFILTRFYRQRKGEFVPDYPTLHHGKQNGEAAVEDVENISSFIDPSAPRITDVPHKPTRAQAAAAGGGGAGAKKTKKPMGVKVTYKPPKWD